MARVYRCEATSVAGFVQQLAVAYVCRGYFYYSSGVVPENKDLRAVDAKLIERYEVNVSKWERARRKRLGIACLQYLRYDRFFVLVATRGRGRFFDDEPFRDFRRRPLYFAGYSVSSKPDREGKLHPHVRISKRQMALLKSFLMEVACRRDVVTLAKFFQTLDVEPYAPVKEQLFELLRLCNRLRAGVRLEPVPNTCLRLRRRVIRPFE